MTLILEFKNKFTFYKPGILRYAMRQAGPRISGLQSRAQRREHLSQSFKRGWAEARAELAALQWLQALTPSGAALLLRDHVSKGAAITSPSTAPATALAHQQLH
ncbi:hypothetical protein [uncultured Bosea sp.]|uniref:hypothetical protein n=1 Tax=uncultured Bosea sp. TaxID=211457 RepID=UPI0025DBEC1E|nr:hypothetical protein [uncultured Bosea sp.]